MATLPPEGRPSPEHIFQTLNAQHQTAVLKTGIELDVFTAIDEGNHLVEQIASSVQAAPRGVRILCDYLTIMGFLRKRLASTLYRRMLRCSSASVRRHIWERLLISWETKLITRTWRA